MLIKPLIRQGNYIYDFLNNAIQISRGKLVIESAQDFLESGCGNVTVTLTIVETESFLQLSEMTVLNFRANNNC